jgi:hypothetical protein
MKQIRLSVATVLVILTNLNSMAQSISGEKDRKQKYVSPINATLDELKNSRPRVWHMP